MSVGAYSVKHYQNLPSLETARAKFAELNGDDLVKNVFKRFFVEEGMERTFGLSIPHRHFDIQSDQMLVDYGGTSTPWPVDGMAGMPPPKPSMWSISSEGDFKPTEFYYSVNSDFVIGNKERLFMQSFKELLLEHGATESFGLCRYPGDDFGGLCEITLDKANINLKPSDWPANLTAVDTAWFFYEPIWKRGCRCTCNTRDPNHAHGVHIYTMSG